MTGPVIRKPLPHDSAALYVTGAAEFVDDRKVPANCLSVALGLSQVAHGKIISLDFTDTLASDGVITVLTAQDITKMMPAL